MWLGAQGLLDPLVSLWALFPQGRLQRRCGKDAVLSFAWFFSRNSPPPSPSPPPGVSCVFCAPCVICGGDVGGGVGGGDGVAASDGTFWVWYRQFGASPTCHYSGTG